MGKRSEFKRVEKDYCPTLDKRAIPPLLPHLPDNFTYHEPCVGKWHLVHLLYEHGLECAMAHDIEKDARTITSCQGDMFITNPPWSRKILHPIIDNLSGIAPTWLLFDAGWAFTKQSAPYMERCQKIVAVGRLSWMDNGVTGKDDCAWYLFDINKTGPTQFFGR